MNLFDMLRRGDRAIAVDGEVIPDKRKMFGEVWRGIRLAPGSQLRLKGARRFYPLAAMPTYCGWFAFTPGILKADSNLEVDLTATDCDTPISTTSLQADRTPQPVELPWSFGTTPPPTECDLVLRNRPHNRGRAGEVFVAVHRVLSRATLIEAASGNGVEIGPGPNPQLRPSATRTMIYVEQMPPDAWNRLYNADGKYKVDSGLWQFYRIGDAAALPVDDGSLDFIFSSHVFEHLSNPFGHLRRWHQKLKPNGLVLAVVPDLCGTKDALHEPSEMSEWLEEDADEVWEPTLRHYTRHVTKNMPGHDPKAIMAQRRSIHAHYFTNHNMRKLLDYACANLGYAWFKIEHTTNHKDFHFILARG